MSPRTQRATSAQRSLLMSRLARHGFTRKQICASDRTGPSWRDLFKAAGSDMPSSPFDWPTVDDWIGGLTMAGAHQVIDLLQAREARP